MTDELLERIKKSRLHTRANCCGTALYLHGITEIDVPCDYWMFDVILLNLTSRIQEPVRGDIIAYRDGEEYFHAGIILYPEKRIVCHRSGTNENILETSLDDMQYIMGTGKPSEFYKMKYSKPEFYRKIGRIES